MKIRRGLSGEDGDGIFKLFALLLEKDRLRARGVEESLFLRDVETGSDSAGVARVDELEAFGQRVNRAAKNADFGVHLSQGKVVAGEFGGDDETRVFKASPGGLVGGLRGFDGMTAAAKEIRFVTDGEGKHEGGLRERSAWDNGVARWPIAGEALAKHGWRRAELGELRGDLQGGGGAGLLKMSGGDFQSLICVERVEFEGIERVVVKDGPPFAFVEGIVRRAFAKGSGDVPVRGDGSGGALILWADGATGEEQSERQESRDFCETTTQCAAPDFAPDFAPGFAGAGGCELAGAGFCGISFTLTGSPSSSESAGLRTIQSDEVMPCNTSREVP